MPVRPSPLLEEQPRLDLGVIDDVPITPVEIVQPRRSRERRKLSYHHRWLQGRIQERGAELVEKLIECALAGDLVAMKLCLERGWGVPVRTAVPIALQPTTNAHEVRQAMHAVFDRVAAGELDLESAASLIVSYRHLLATYDNMSVPMLQGASVMDARTQLAARFQRAIEARQRETGTEPPPPADQYVAISSPAGPPNSADAAPASTTTDNDAARNARLAQMLRSTIEHLEQQQQQED